MSRQVILYSYLFLFFFFNDTATTEIYTLSLHDALPIYCERSETIQSFLVATGLDCFVASLLAIDRKSTRLNSSHVKISYAVFCLKKKKKKKIKKITKNKKKKKKNK